MKKFLIKYIIGLVFITSTFITACSDRDDILESIDFDRLFAPVGMKANVFKVTELNLTWDAVTGANKYIVEIYSDSLLFEAGNFVYSEEVSGNKFVREMEADIWYSARVKSMGENIEESNWNAVAFQTGIPDIFLEELIGDVSLDFITMRWSGGTVATELQFKPESGETVKYPLSDTELAEGIATVTGLTPGVKYTVTLYNNKQRKSQTVKTTFPEGTIIVEASDDLLSVISSAPENSTLMVQPGDYLFDGIKVPINKNITISGYNVNNRPVIHAHFEVTEVAEFTLNNIILDGVKSAGGMVDHVLQFTASGNCGKIVVEGCIIRDYNKSLVAAAGSVAVKVQSITINNSIVSNIMTNSADCIDIRAGLVQNLNLTNSTFYNCASSPARDFIRLDDASGTFSGETSNVLIDNCTLYKVSDDHSKRLLYVRFVDNTLTIKNSIFAETKAMYTNQAKSSKPVFSKNNYSAANALWNENSDLPAIKFDDSGSYTTLDPGFKNSADGDFTISNETLRSNGIGDPRWIE